MRQDVDADPDRLNLRCSLIHAARDSGAMQRERECESADPPADDDDVAVGHAIVAQLTETGFPLAADATIASSTATPLTASSGATRNGCFDAAASANASSSARSASAAGKVNLVERPSRPETASSVSLRTSSQPLDPKTCTRRKSPVAYKVPK